MFKKIFEKRMRNMVELDNTLMEFLSGRGTVDAIFVLRREKYEMAGRKLNMVFVDLEKAFDRVPREVIWWVLRRKIVLERLVFAVTEMYKNTKTSVKIDGKRSKEFKVKIEDYLG